MKGNSRSSARLVGALACGMLLFSITTVGLAESFYNNSLTFEPKETQFLTGTGSALAQLAQAVSKVEVSEPSMVVVGKVGGAADTEAHSPGEAALSALRDRILTTVASAIVLAAQRETTPLSQEEARRKARNLELPLVYLAPTLSRGSITLRVTVDKWPRGLWQRAVHAKGLRAASALFEVAADSSVRSLFPRPALSTVGATRLSLPLLAPLAVACGAERQTGERTLAFVNRQEVAVASLQGKNVALRTSKHWASLADVSGTPLRDPLAAAHFERGSLVIGLSDRAALITLSEDLSQVSYGQRLYPLGKGLCAEFSATGLVPNAVLCPAPQSKPPTKQLTPQIDSEKSRDAFARGTFVLPSGILQTVSVELDHRTSRAAVALSSASEQTRQFFIEDTGSALLVADLDGDGAAEIISSSAGDGSRDVLRVHTTQGGKVSLVKSLSTGTVHAISVCPFSGKNPLTLIAAAGDDLWVIH